MKQILLLVAIISFIACNQNTQSKETNTSNAAVDSVQTIINTKLANQSSFINTYDAEGCSTLFADDATVVEYLPEAKIMSGRKQIDSTLAAECEMFRQQKAVFDIKWTTNSLRVNGDMAYYDAKVTYSMKMPGVGTINNEEDAMMAWKKTAAGEWRVHVMVFHLL